MPNKEATFSYLMTQEGQQIKMVSNINLKEVLYSPNQYPSLRSFYDTITNKFEEQIVLKKKL